LSCRGVNLGRALQNAAEASPSAFLSLQLSDIQEALDFFALPPGFLHEHLVELARYLPSTPSTVTDHPNFEAALPALLRLNMAASARCTALNIAHCLGSAPRWALWHGGMYFALVVPSGFDDDKAPGCLSFSLPDPEFVWTDATMLPTLKVLEKLTEMRMDPHKSWVEKDRLEVDAFWCERFQEDDPRRSSVRPPEEYSDEMVLTPAACPAFCSVALVEELEGLGLSASWHRGPLCLKSGKFIDHNDEEVDNGRCNTSHFLFVSWM